MTLKLLPLDQWPSADRQAWECAIRSGNCLEDGGPASHWAERTKRTILFDYRRWLGHLHHADPDVLDLAPADRVTENRIRIYVAMLQATIKPSGTHNYIKHLFDAVRVMHPGLDWRWLSEVARRLEQLVTPRNKRPRMVSSHELDALGRRLMEEANRATELRALQRAILYRDGLMIALLAARPLRRRNYAGIVIGQNLIKSGDGYHLCFGAEETKTHTALEFPFPDDLVMELEHYLDTYRNAFPGADNHDNLWASAKGVPLGEDAIYSRITKHTKEAFGKSVNPHLFRDCVATTIAIEDPEHVGIAADLLGHTSLEFTQTHYIQADTIRASQSYHSSIKALRQQLSKAAHERQNQGRS